MNEEEVRRRLGEPKDVRAESGAVLWYYGRPGQRPWVKFLDDRVVAWDEPGTD
jgi:hypothetical protein